RADRTRKFRPEWQVALAVIGTQRDHHGIPPSSATGAQQPIPFPSVRRAPLDRQTRALQGGGNSTPGPTFARGKCPRFAAYASVLRAITADRCFRSADRRNT